MLYIGIDLGGTNIAGGIVNEEGKILHSASIPTGAERGAEPIVRDMANLCLRLIEESGHTLDDIAAVGVGVPGIANADTGVVYFCTNLRWHNVPVRDIMQMIINKPIVIENDGTVAGLAEATAGVSKGAKNAIFLTLGTGVGGGILLDGKVYSGSHHVGSELGHIIIEANGRECTCGNRGCWERYSSATALINDGIEVMKRSPNGLIAKATGGDPSKVTAKVVIDAAKEGDPGAEDVFRNYVYYMAKGIVSIINAFDPEVIALGGGVSKAGAFLRDALREEVAKWIFYKEVGYARIELAELGNDAGIIGAAMMGRGYAPLRTAAPV